VPPIEPVTDGARSVLDRAVLDHVQLAVLVMDLTGTVVDCNRHAAELFGLARAELVGSSSTAFTLEAIDPDLRREIGHRLQAREPWEGDFRLRRADGTVAVVHAIDSGVFDDDGRLTGVVSVATDVTERWRATRRLVAQHEMTRVLATAGDLDEASGRIVELLRDELEWSLGALWEGAADGDVLRCVAVSAADDVDPTFAKETLATCLARGEGLPGRVWADGEPAWIEDVTCDANFPRARAAAGAGLHRALAVPVAGRDDVLGVLELFGTTTQPVDEDLVATTVALASQLGQFLDRRRAEDAARTTEARRAAMFEAALDAIVSIDRDGRVIEWNPAAQSTFGWTRDEAIGTPMHELVVPPDLREHHVRGFARHLATGYRSMLGRRVETRAVRRDGAELPVELTIARIDAGPEPVFTAFMRDISDRVRAETEREDLARREQAARSRLELLAQLGNILTVERDVRARLQAMAGVLLPVFADMCAVITRDPDGSVRLVALAHADPVKQALIDAVGDWRPFVLDDVPAVEEAVTLEPLLLEHIQPGMLDFVFGDEHERELVRAFDLKSVVSVPLPGEEGPIGAIAFATSDPSRRYTEDDLALAEEIARRFGPAVESALQLERERHVAETLQRSLLPEHLPDVPEVDLAARYLPATAGVSVGGDWYDVLALSDGRVLFAIGDVVGHGVRAAAVMGRARAALQFCALAELEPSEVLTRLNAFFSAAADGSMSTLFVMVYDPATTTAHYASAGHPPALVREASGEVRALEGARGTPLAADAVHTFVQCTETLSPGATVLLYTDGLVERRRESLDVGFARLHETFRDGPRDLEALVDHVVAELVGPGGGADDVAVLAFRPAPENERLSLTLPTDPRQLRVLRSRLAGWLTRRGVDAETVFDLNLAVTEAAGNAIAHAYGLGDGEFGVDVHLEDDVVVCTVTDRGHWRAERRDGYGRGLMLMRALTEQVEIETSDDGTRVEMRRRVAVRCAG